MSMNFKRSERVAELLRHEISVLVQQIKDPGLGFVTITEVHLSDDLMEAKVFYSIFGSQEEREIGSKILISSIPSMRHQLGRKLESLKRVPVLHFIFDETPEKAQRIMSILNHISEEREKDGPSDPAPEQ